MKKGTAYFFYPQMKTQSGLITHRILTCTEYWRECVLPTVIHPHFCSGKCTYFYAADM